MRTSTPTDHLDAVILYEDVCSGKRAKEFCDRLENQLPPDRRLKLGLWSFCALEWPGLAQIAAREAEQATFVIVAANGDDALPQTVEDCLGRVFREMRIRDDGGLRFFSQAVELPDQKETSPLIRHPAAVAEGLYAEVKA